MDLILADANGREERVIVEDIDLNIGDTNDFEIRIPLAAWTGDLTFGKRIYIPGTEYGGIIGKVISATNTDEIRICGYTWRGYLGKRIIVPPAGQDYYIASGDFNTILNNLISVPGLVVPSKSSGRSVSSYQFNRYVTVLSGLTDMLTAYGYRLDFKYIQTQSSGYTQVQAVPITTYNDELSQDGNLYFAAEDNRMGVNHLICLGSGELAQRMVRHLYADKNGNISQTQTLIGTEEVVDVFDYSSAQDANELIKFGTQRLQEIMSKKTFDASLKDMTGFNLEVGDIITGRDYITGAVVKKPIIGKTLKVEGGKMSVEYRIEG